MNPHPGLTSSSSKSSATLPSTPTPSCDAFLSTRTSRVRCVESSQDTGTTQGTSSTCRLVDKERRRRFRGNFNTIILPFYLWSSVHSSRPQYLNSGCVLRTSRTFGVSLRGRDVSLSLIHFPFKSGRCLCPSEVDESLVQVVKLRTLISNLFL